jgi:hypothetical protein
MTGRGVGKVAVRCVILSGYRVAPSAHLHLQKDMMN